MESSQQRPGPADGREVAPQNGGADVPKSARRRPPLWVLIAGAIVVIAILIWGARFLSYALSHQSTDDARVDADTVTVTSKIQERVKSILVDTNQPVHKGQIIVRLDDTDERAGVQQAQAALSAQQAQARAAQENVSLTRADVAAQATAGHGRRERGARRRFRTPRRRHRRRGSRPTPRAPRSRRRKRSCAAPSRRCRRRVPRCSARTPTTAATPRWCGPATSRGRSSTRSARRRRKRSRSTRPRSTKSPRRKPAVAQAQAKLHVGDRLGECGDSRDRRAAGAASDGPRQARARATTRTASRPLRRRRARRTRKRDRLRAQLADRAGPARIHGDPFADRRRSSARRTSRSAPPSRPGNR